MKKLKSKLNASRRDTVFLVGWLAFYCYESLSANQLSYKNTKNRIDHGRLSSLSLSLTLLSIIMGRHKYDDDDCGSTPDVAGFTPIDVKSQPWCSLLEPALKRHPIYEEQKTYSPAAIITYMRAPLARRIETLVKSARKGIAEKVKALARQDKRQAEKASARMEAQLDAAHEDETT